MNRRSFLVQSAALALAGSAPLAGFAQPAARRAPFRPTRFSVEVRGRGPDVVLIPGLTSGRHVWERAVRDVPGFRYHLVQVGGFAGEPVRGNADGPVVAPLVAEIARYIEANGLKRPALIGHSMGGTLAMMVAAQHPASVGKVMVVDMMPQPTALYGGSAASRLAAGLRDMMQDPGGRQLIAGLITAFSPPDDGDARRSNPDVVARAMHDLGTIDLTGDLPRLRMPLTVVYALRGFVGAAATGRAFAQAYRGARGARLIPVPDSGHLIMVDQPARFAGALREFLG
jgi:pimeloyl-ACP methyl ester carboxylesterase